jgi:thioesterase domain-containing protein
MPSDPASITGYLHQQMPLTKAMGVQVIQANDEQALITAPLAPNLNHQQTAFGGSIAALGITAGWVYLHCRLEGLGIDARLIIQKSQVEYLHPADDEFEASCIAPPVLEWDDFIAALKKRGRSRISRAAQIQCRGRIVAIHHGSYVAIDQNLAQKRGVRG